MRPDAAFVRVLAALIVTASACLPAARAPTPSVTPGSPSPASSSSPPSTTPSPSPSLSPSPPPASSAGVHATAVTLPDDPHFFSVGGQDSTRILLFDSAATSAPVEAVRFDPAPVPAGPDVRTIAFGASADGRILVIARRFSEQRTVHYLVHPQTGEVVVLLTDLASSLSAPVLSTDGARYAFARSGDAAGTGVFIADARAGPDPKRIVASDPQIVGSPPQPSAWSPDGKWLAVTYSNDSGCRIGVVQLSAGETTLDIAHEAFAGGSARLLGYGCAIDWRGGDQNLLVTSSRNAFGGRSFVYTSTVSGGPPRELYVPNTDTVLSGAAWHPALDRFFVDERPLCCGVNAPSTISIRKPDGSGANVFASPFVDVPWWSKDGARLWAQVGGDDSVGYLRDLLSTTSVMFCLRSASPPCL